MAMRPGIALLLAALLLPAGGIFAPGAATVIRGTTTSSTNPAVEAGGHRVTKVSPDVPYSVVGAIAIEEDWFGRCLTWPWRLLHGISGRHHAPSHLGPLQGAPSRR